VDFAEILKRRRMVRNYRPDPIDREALERILLTVRRAPSAGFSQGQRLLVVTDGETRGRIAELAGEAEAVAEGREPWISRAPVHVFVCTREDDYHDRYREPDKLALGGGEEIGWPVPFWHVDAGAAMMLLLLGAIDEGLAAGVFGVPVEATAAAKDLLAVPEDVTIVAVVTIGHPASDPSSAAASSRKKERRRPLDDLVHWERWRP
jgi:FMN reductase [NAD(P)H]